MICSGVLFVCLALVADAAIGNIQEKAVRLFHGTTLEVVFFTHLIGGIYILIGLVVTGELFQAILFCAEVGSFWDF